MKSFYTLHPNHQFNDNWHIDLICEYLQAITAKKINRLIINIPPRHLKSMCVSIAWPAWLMGNDPGKKIISCSYSQIISEKNALAHRHLVYEKWFQEAFPHFKLCNDQNTKNKFQTTQHGFRFTTNIGGSLLGEGGDLIIIDDPQNPCLINCDYYQRNTIDWFENILLTRLNDYRKGAIILIMHRIHINDLTGHILSKNHHHWEHLALPIYNNNKLFSVKNYKFKKNTVLHEKRFNKKDIKQIKQDVGHNTFQAQYQQQPVKQNSQLIDVENIERFEQVPTIDISFWQSWDTANSENKTSDYSVCSTWIMHKMNFYLIHIIKGRWNYIKLKENIINNYRKWPVQTILIENKASGQQLIQELNHILPIKKIDVGQSNKINRFSKIIHLFENKTVKLPKKASWLDDLEQELNSFPNAKHDDQIDSISQFLNFHMQKILENMRVRTF